MKKQISLVMAGAMAAGLLAGCGGAASSAASDTPASSSEAVSSEASSEATGHEINTTDPITLTPELVGRRLPPCRIPGSRQGFRGQVSQHHR